MPADNSPHRRYPTTSRAQARMPKTWRRKTAPTFAASRSRSRSVNPNSVGPRTKIASTPWRMIMASARSPAPNRTPVDPTARGDELASRTPVRGFLFRRPAGRLLRFPTGLRGLRALRGLRPLRRFRRRRGGRLRRRGRRLGRSCPAAQRLRGPLQRHAGRRYGRRANRLPGNVADGVDSHLRRVRRFFLRLFCRALLRHGCAPSVRSALLSYQSLPCPGSSATQCCKKINQRPANILLNAFRTPQPIEPISCRN
jgi:hypothetical protein